MKKIFFFALASLALASCSQDEEFVAEKSNGSSRVDNGGIAFSTYTAGATRADVVDADAVKASGFQINAWYDGSLYFNAGEAASLSADTDDNTDDIFDTDNELYYWPSFSAGAMGFRAFNIITGASWNKEGISINFAPATSASTQVDLVVAHDSVDAKPTAHGNGIQPLNFTHALSKVNFSFVGATAGNKYTINKVEVIAAGQPTGTNTSTFATFTDKVTTVSTDMKQSEIVTWDVEPINVINGDNPLVEKNATAGAVQGVLYDYDMANDIVVESNTIPTDCNYNFMLLPQTGKIAVRVYYKVETPKKNDPTAYNLIGNCGYYKTDANGRHEGNDNYGKDADGNALASTPIYGCKTLIIDLADVFTTGWEAGKSYRFTLTLPDDNFIGDGAASTGNTPDGVADGSDNDATNPTDYDGDGDTDKSEFDQLTPIRFCVTVSDWVDYTPAPGNVTIK